MGLGGEPLTKISAGNTEVEYSAPSLREKEGLRGREEGGGGLRRNLFWYPKPGIVSNG